MLGVTTYESRKGATGVAGMRASALVVRQDLTRGVRRANARQELALLAGFGYRPNQAITMPKGLDTRNPRFEAYPGGVVCKGGLA